MSTSWLFTLPACACLFLIGCTQTPRVDTRAEADALRKIEDQWAAANKAKDINKAVSFFCVRRCSDGTKQTNSYWYRTHPEIMGILVF
jgi:outer membrane biogenesis lipoprotein LolB